MHMPSHKHRKWHIAIYYFWVSLKSYIFHMIFISVKQISLGHKCDQGSSHNIVCIDNNTECKGQMNQQFQLNDRCVCSSGWEGTRISDIADQNAMYKCGKHWAHSYGRFPCQVGITVRTDSVRMVPELYQFGRWFAVLTRKELKNSGAVSGFS